MRKHLHIFLFVFMALVSCVDDPLMQENAPVINMAEPVDLKRTSVILEAELSGPDISSVTEYGFLIGENSSLTDNKVTVKVDAIENGRYFAQVKDLQIGHTYFYAAYATNGKQTIRTQTEALTTLTRSSALLGDVEVFEKNERTYLRSSIEDNGGATINMTGFCFDKSPNPTVYRGNATATLGEDNTFTADVTDYLTPGEVYYIRAFVDNDIMGDGTTSISYSLQTTYDVPVVELLEVPDPAFKDFLVSEYDANGDGEISTREISSVTSLTICTDGITSLKGIEKFVNLESLWACGTMTDAKGNGGLADLDLRMNKKLVSLECYNNKIENLYLAEDNQIQHLDARVNNLKYINTFDFPELTFISLYGSYLTEVDFSKCSKLVELTYECNPYDTRGKANLNGLTNLKKLHLFNVECPDNIKDLNGLEELALLNAGLQTFDLSYFPDLLEFSCTNNDLTELDLTKVPNLKSLDFQGNKLKSVDLSCVSCLETLICDSNELLNLDLSNNSNLGMLSCGRNNLSVLDISNATGLYNLYCKGNSDLHTIYVWEGFNEADYPGFYKDDDTRYVVKGQGNGGSSILSDIPDENFRAYVLENFDYDHNGDVTTEEALEVEYIDINTDNVYSLEGIGYFENLIQIVAEGSEYYEDYAYKGQLTELDLTNNTKLTHLWCQFNHVRHIEFHPDTKIEVLGIGYNQELTGFSDFDMSALECVYLRETMITYLDLREAVNLDRIEYSYSPDSSIKRSLNIDGLTKITHMELWYLDGNLDVSSLPNLKYLCAEYCNLISLDLRNNPKLEELIVNSNQLTNIDLCSGTSLKSLDVSFNNLSELDLSQNSALTYMDAAANPDLHTIYVWDGFKEADYPDFQKDSGTTYVVKP